MLLNKHEVGGPDIREDLMAYWSRKAWLLAAAASATMVSVPAFAQEASDDESNFGDIIVTAQKREERLQEVPVAVSAFDAQVLQESGVRDIKDLIILAPSLNVTSTASESSTTARIRGIGTVGDNPGLESSVGVTIDGVYRPRNSVGFGDLGEIERIEVLRGPQGTLFGKNTSAGVLNVVTARPSFNFGGSAELTAGNYGAAGASGSITGPLGSGETLAARLYGVVRQRDGFLDVVTGTGPRVQSDDVDQKYYSFRGQLLWVPTENIDVRIIADLSHRDENCCAAVQLFTGTTSAFIDALTPNDTGTLVPVNRTALGLAPTLGTNRLLPNRPYDRVAFANRDTNQVIEEDGISAEVNWETGIGDITSVTAFRNWESTNAQDSDFTTADILYRPADGQNAFRFEQFSQELRMQGTAFGDRLDWLVGAFYANEDLTRRDALLFGSQYTAYWDFLAAGTLSPASLNAFITAGTPLPPLIQATLGTVGLPGTTPAYPTGGGSRDSYLQNSESIALFTHNNIKLTEQLELTLGLRWTQEEKNVTSDFSTNAPGCATVEGILGRDLAVGQTLSASLAQIRALGQGIFCVLPSLRSGLDNGVFQQSSTEEEFSGTAKVSFQVTPDVLTYFSYARGYKAGGFNLDRAFNGVSVVRNPANITATNPTGIVSQSATYANAFPGEFVDSYELAMKSTLFGGDVLFNLTGFYQIFENFQLNTFTGISFIVTPIPEVTSRGAELELGWITPVEGLTLNGNVAYAQTQYEDRLFPTGATTTDNTLPGSNLSLSPEWYVNGNVAYERPVMGTLTFRGNLAARWTSEYNTGSDLLPPKIQDAFTVVNLTAGIGAEDDSWRVELWSKNLLDEEYTQVGFNGTLQGGSGITSSVQLGGVADPYNPLQDTITYNAFLGAPRTFGATVRFKY
jgi:iron complex outermembrane recepter protein